MSFLSKNKSDGWFKRIMRRIFILPVEPRALIFRIWYINIYSNIYAFLRKFIEFRDIVNLSDGNFQAAKRIAVVACHKPTPDFAFALDALRNSGYHLVGYVYSETDAKRFFNERDTVFLRTASFGRDFYVYKHAALYVLANLPEYVSAMFINDSCFFGNEISSVIEWFVEHERSNWLTFSVNLRKHFHAGSYLFQISGKARAAVQLFLIAYFPRNTRYHAIHFGETMLSHHLIRSGFTPRAWMWDEDSVGRLADTIAAETELTGAKHSLLSDIISLNLMSGYEMQSVLANDERFRVEMVRYSEDDNVLNRVGLYLFDYGLVPILKKDVLYRNKKLSLIRYAPKRGELRSLEYLSVLYARERYMRSFPHTFRGKMRKLIAQIDD